MKDVIYTVKVKYDLTGKTFGRLTVLWQAEDYVKPSGKRESRWLCECNCGEHNKVIVVGTHLKNGQTTSCGCYAREISSQNGKNPNCHKRTKIKNKYDLSGEYGIGYTSNDNTEFYFDLEDYDLIKNYTWMLDSNGYIVDSNSSTFMHRFVLQYNGNLYVDHIYHNKHDNRKNNLRLCDCSQSSMNRGIQSNNTSGNTGIYFHKPSGSWCAYIKVNGKQYRKYSHDKNKALEYRKQLEDKYFKDFSYNNSMNGDCHNE